MGKKKQKQKSQIKVEDVKADTLMPIDDERITKIIVNALAEYDKQKQEAAKVEKEKERETAEAKLGIKGNKGKLLAVLKVMVFPKKYKEMLTVNTVLLRVALKSLYKIVEIILYIIAACLFLCLPLHNIFPQLIIPQLTNVDIGLTIALFVFSFPTFLLARIFRMAGIELEDITDSNYIFGLFAALTSIVSIIVAIVALLK